MQQIKTGDIITLIKYDTAPGYWTETECRERGIIIGRAYKCIDTLILTAPNYYITERASQPGVTIESTRGRWGINKSCIPTECFRLATQEEKLDWMWNKPYKYTRGIKMLRKALNKKK